jgi:hypothetical protein
MDRKLVYIFLAWLAGLLIVGFFSLSLSSFSQNSERYTNDPPFYRWDSNWYISIADSGYSFSPEKNSNIAFFPLYPALIRAGHELTGIRMSWVGFYLSITFALGAFLMLYRLLLLDYVKSQSLKIVIFWILFPFSYFLISVYTESLFVFLAVTSLYFARKKRWLAASIIAALAVLSRPYGIFLLPVLIWEYFSDEKFSLAALRQKGFWLISVIPLATFLLFIVYNKLRFNEPFAFLLAQQNWGRMITSPLPVFFAYTREILKSSTYTVQNLHFAVDFAVVLFALTAIYLSIKKLIRPTYILLGILLITPALLSGTFTSIHRYVFVAFPFFIAPVLTLEKNSWLFGGYCFLSFLLLLYFASLFVRWAPIF